MNILSIVVTYNRKELLKECIFSLEKQKNIQSDILIIDNASTDGTEEMVKKNFPNVIYQNTGSNLGGAGGFNYGIRFSFELEKKYDYLWIMDDDTIPTEDALLEITKVVNTDANFGFISPKTMWIDQTLCLMNRQTDINNKKITQESVDMTKLDHCTFVACFLNVKAILEVGLPIKEFFIWSDDTEYTQRISKKYNCYYASNSIVIHKMKNNHAVSIEFDVEERIDRYFFLYRNRFYIAKKNGIKKIIRFHCSIIKKIIRVLVRAKSMRLKRIKVILKGYFAGIRFNPRVEFADTYSVK